MASAFLPRGNPCSPRGRAPRRERGCGVPQVRRRVISGSFRANKMIAMGACECRARKLEYERIVR